MQHAEQSLEYISRSHLHARELNVSRKLLYDQKNNAELHSMTAGLLPF